MRFPNPHLVIGRSSSSHLFLTKSKKSIFEIVRGRSTRRAEFKACNVLHPGLRVAILKALCDIRVEVNQLKRDLLPTMTSGVMYWPFYDFVTFKFIPVHLQPLVSNSFSYLWTVYLTYMASLEKASTSQ